MEGYKKAEGINETTLKAGNKVRLKKISSHGMSSVPVGSEQVGVLDTDVVIGAPVSLNNGGGNTTSVVRMEKTQNTLRIYTQTSVYELSHEANEGKPKIVTTARGSQYIYLDDGRTQRFKKATGELHEPQDILVFIPPWNKVASSLKSLYPHIFGRVENHSMFEQVILQYVHGQNKSLYVVDKDGRRIDASKDIKDGEYIALAFVDKDKDSKVDFFVPVSNNPQIGWNTFDARKYVDAEGRNMRERHIGNTVVAIDYN